MWQHQCQEKWLDRRWTTEISLQSVWCSYHHRCCRTRTRRKRSIGQQSPSRTGKSTWDCPSHWHESVNDHQTAKKKTFRPIGHTITPSAERPVLEMDEIWSYVDSKGNQVWVWIALERQTRKVVGLAFGDRSAVTCRELWQSLPADYRKRAIIYTDEWNAYSSVLPRKRHRPMPKGSGETNHIERLNNTLRQWCANLVRKTLSFSKDLELHKTRIRMVIEHCNVRADLWSAV